MTHISLRQAVIEALHEIGVPEANSPEFIKKAHQLLSRALEDNPDEGNDGGQHTYHHYAALPPTVNMSAERNSRGYNFSVTILNATSNEEAAARLREAIALVKFEIGETEPTGEDGAGDD
jgi:hypothetical protein